MKKTMFHVNASSTKLNALRKPFMVLALLTIALVVGLAPSLTAQSSGGWDN